MKFSEMVAIHPRYGYKYLSPMPTESELADFYAKIYYISSRGGLLTPDLGRLAMNNEAGMEAEINWLSKTLWADIYGMIDTYLGPSRRTILDLGCGTGFLARFLLEHDCRVVGVDPAKEVAEYTRTHANIQVFHNLDELKSVDPEPQFDTVMLIHLLEHVLDPVRLISEVRTLLSLNGLIIIRVPNDFSVLQVAARQILDIDPWWISYPDHINYFGFESLASLLVDSGFRILNEMGDFPMEFFLLFGDDYISDPSLGKQCHIKRRNFELALPNEIRRDIYRGLAEKGIGRNCIIVAQLIG